MANSCGRGRKPVLSIAQPKPHARAPTKPDSGACCGCILVRIFNSYISRAAFAPCVCPVRMRVSLLNLRPISPLWTASASVARLFLGGLMCLHFVPLFVVCACSCIVYCISVLAFDPRHQCRHRSRVFMAAADSNSR